MSLNGGRFVLWGALLAQSALVCAQGVYVTQGEHGPVYSDKPQSGAREVVLRPLTVLESPRDKPSEASGGRPTTSGKGGSRPASVPAYERVVLLLPEDESSVIINYGSIDVRVASEPALMLGEGHAFVLSINGRDVGPRFTVTEFTVPPEFWGGNPPINQYAQLDLRIVDAAGKTLLRAPSVRVFLRHTTVLNNPQRPRPFPIFTPIAPVVPTSPPQVQQPKPAAERGGAFRAPAGKGDK